MPATEELLTRINNNFTNNKKSQSSYLRGFMDGADYVMEVFAIPEQCKNNVKHEGHPQVND